MSTATANQSPTLLTQIEVARALGVPLSTVRNLISRGLLTEAKSYPGCRARFRPADVAALKARYEGATSPAGA